ncbi:efflux RND transporter permease subunit [Cognatiyoonia sp. IB215182]|uniref:efflux RND transporter permease subunit n=1 Tax=Cognatiyoonia sp. IB215182 TaxID=3097353 RepID=UPI002A121BB8|nr:efflux RND transporter permease subunit [Cognatiyoonia sp. IB215182]MDX8355108.1 efflux RND transporter permease subunit [Cognatiyoonia sp. IB215182]
MQIARLAILNPLYTWLLILFCLFGGAAGYLSVGKLEDPVFTLKSALVITPYPGATAAEVAVEVSEVLEAEIQQMDEIDFVTSANTPGLSVIEVTIQDTYDGTELPQVWDDMRDRIADAVPALPQGALAPVVNDSFGDVFGLLYAVTAPGYADSDIWEIGTFLRRELLGVDGVANAEILGLPEEAVFVEPSSATLTALGVPPDVILGAVANANTIVPTGTADDARRDLRVDAPAPDDSVSEISALTFGFQGEVINLTDIAQVYRGRVSDPGHIIRHNGQEAFTIGVAGLTSENIVSVGQRVEERLDALATLLPAGVTLQPIYEQHRVVDMANRDFLGSLAMSVGVVIGVLALFMGWRAAVVVGGSLLLTVSFTFFFMNIFDIKIERISLGALIIAMGMLVDNAIVIAEGMQIQMRRGRKAIDAAADVARRTQTPLLGATIIGIMAFAGIGLSPDSSGEFLFSLFAVIAISLLLSWLIAVTVTPLLASYFFKTEAASDAKDPYDTVFFRMYAGVVRASLRVRWLVIIGLIGATVAGVGAMGGVKQQFFPPATTPLVYLNYKGVQGSSIASVSDDLAIVEDWLLERPDVAAVTTTIGQSMTRFMLTYTPADPDPSFGQLVIRVNDHTEIPALRNDLTAFTGRAIPWAETRVEQIIYGPPVGADVEVRLSGPDPDVLRGLAMEVQRIFETQTDLLTVERIDWRERELTTQPIYAVERAQSLGISRSDVAQAIALGTDGIRAGTFRENDRLIPIVIRTPAADQTADGVLLDQPVYAPSTQGYTTLAQVIDGFQVIARDTLIQRRDRVNTISVQAFTVPDVLPPQAFAEVRGAIEAMELPPGYRFEWGGEFESASTAQASLGRQMPLAFGTMLLITILLFGKLRQTAVIWTVVPMAVTGVGFGLLYTNLPFSFTALLGLLSLSGMLIKNAIVLVEEIDAQKIEEGRPQSEAIVAASVSRLRPVILAAATTILGMVPLLADAFFASMAVAIMAGLGFASILTLIGVPALYHTYLRKERREEKRNRAGQKKSGALPRLLGRRYVPGSARGPQEIAAE